MSELSFIERLLDGVEVDWVPISEVTLRTSNIKWSEVKRDYKYIDLTSVSIETKQIVETSWVSPNNAPSRAQKLVEKKDVIFATTRPTQMRYCLIGDDYHGEVASTGYCVLRAEREKVLPKWILHLISTSEFKRYLEDNQSGSAYPAISDAKVKAFSIPIPCPEIPEKSLQIQAEIVRILDAFTSLTAELTAELTARKKQYNYYRDKLLSFEGDEVEWKPLGEVVNIKNGKDWKNLGAGDIPVYGSGGVMTYVDSFAYDKPTVLIPRKGSITNIFYVDEPFWNVDTIYYTEIDTTQIVPKFFYYFMRTLDLMKLDTGSGRPSLTQAILNNILVPVPSLRKQEHIVNVLDKFDALTNSITEGLPREIELRQKQYEYYRDLLLSFPKPDEQAA
ncbi:restriction endonuclease subunit S [Pseudidiomarina sp. GXY010]|uniref:Restriction endonuclease subunit S n=1 Tax=Pseudidiomarina fusca TaxID=2965078 RepID=A0ABU3KWS0_9GAMM|nr:restriction endonuclease subunit S [Pseudidiomarina sp. GXY010]MDT7525346.1 restriction endonuclease subunit S [Pseudidiomarina sp. GXY010]